mgnify:CR=1 FL=1
MATYKSIKYIIPAEVVEHTDSINALADVDTSTTAPTEGQTLKWSAANSRWQPADIEETSGLATTLGVILGGIYDTSMYDIGSHVYITSTGGVGSDTTYSGSLAFGAGATYGGDKGFICTRYDTHGYHLLTNTGVLGAAVSNSAYGIGMEMTGLTYGEDKCIFGWHTDNSTNNSPPWHPQKTNTVTNTGVIGSDTTNPTSSYRTSCIGTSYGGDKGIVIYGYGYTTYSGSPSYYAGGPTNNDGRANLISNTGIVASETACSGTKRSEGSGGEYGGDKAITAYGYISNALTNQINTISNTGVVSSDTTGVGTARVKPSYTRYGGDKGIFYDGGSAYQNSGMGYQLYNLVSNTGVIATNTSITNDGRWQSIGCGYGS